MQTRNTLQLTTAMLAIAAGTGIGLAEGDGAVVFLGGGTGHSSGESDDIVMGQGNFNRFISDETIAENRSIYENREAIALLAQFVGPGPTNIQPLIAGDTDRWLEDLRADAGGWLAGGEVADDARTPAVRVLDRSKPVPASKRGLAALYGGEPVFGYQGGAGIDPGNTTHSVNNLWPTKLIDGSYVAQIPYSFDDDMIAAWVNPDPSEEDLNAIAGIASSLATMLIIEQFAPVQFIGFNPQTDPVNGFLLFTSLSDADFGPAPRAANVVTRLGRPNTSDADAEPTNLQHESWSNFPSIVRSLGFVLGLDWEQRHPDRDQFIEVQPQNLPPQNFPLPIASLDGNDGPGVTRLISPDPNVGGVAGGPLLFDDITVLTRVVDTPGCGFDLESIMLLRPFDLGGSAAYIIDDAFRYEDYNNDGIIDTTPFGEDDRMASQPVSVFFSDCDLAALEEMYSVEFRWYYGFNPNCPHDVNNDGVQGADDLQAFVALWEARDPAADLVAPFGFIDLLDLQAFSQGDEDAGIGIFTPGFCNDFGLPGPNFRPGGNVFPPEG